jgi:WD40 repeat protein/serine/threonine protein kinase
MPAIAESRREKEIFEQAIDLRPEERQRFLLQACGADSGLLARVQELLGAFDQAEGFLADGPTRQGAKSQPAGENRTPGVGGEERATCLTQHDGDRVGRYKLLQKIGEGGCGVVYMAEQLEPVRRRVALKVVKLGMDTKQVIARFEAERQALAVMDHPNIARVLDAGATETGRPYFVMELVRGMRIIQFCNERQLSLRERLDLFIQVCHAIQHAHQKGIIHRDIKPSNILVTLNDGVPVPKVIDFGIAKATQGNLTDKTLFTLFEQFLGTPAYMSPEQAEVRGVDIDTRSDIYSLGVVLYELLTGRTPFDSQALLQRGIEELILTLRQVEPLRPSTRVSTLALADLQTVARSQQCEVPKLVHSLRGDLDWIVMKCLEKDRSRRYDTANGLAMDLQRYLRNEPIIARPPSATYRFQKLVRRNKLAAAAGAFTSLALSIGVAAVIFIQHRANREYRQRFYAYQLGRAGAALTAGQFDHLKAALAQCPSEHRHWEWRYLKSQVERWSRRTVFTVDVPVRKLVVSRDGSLVALMALMGGKQEGRVQVRRLPSGERLCTIDMVTWAWAPLALRPDGGMLAGIPNDDRRMVKIWDPRTGGFLQSLVHEDLITCLAFSPDGRLLAAGGGESAVSCWDLTTGVQQQLALALNHVTALAFSPDGRELAVGTREGEIRFLDLASGRALARFSGGEGEVRSLAFSPDGKQLLSNQVHASLQRGRIRLWNRLDGSSTDLVTTDVANAEFSPDGRWILTGSGSIWDSATGEMLGKLQLGDNGFGLATCFYPSGEILSAGPDGAVILATPNRLAFERLLGHQASLRVLRFSPEGRALASAGLERGVRLWDVAAARQTQTYHGHAAGVAALVWSPNGRSVVSGSLDGELHCWDPITLQLRWTNSLTAIGASPAWWLEFSPDGNRILSSGENGILGFWDSVTGASLGRIKSRTTVEPMDGVAWSPQGDYVAGLFKDHVAVWATAGGQEQWSASVRADRCIRFSPDGRWIAYGDYDGGVSLRNSADGQLVRSFERHQAPVKAVLFSPDGRRLFSGGADGTVRVWDTRTGDELLHLDVAGNRLLWSIDLSSDGQTLAAADSDGVVTLWKTDGSVRP